MDDGISPSEFHAADGTADWRVLGDGATAFFRTSSVAESARLVAAIGALPGVDEHVPDVDVRSTGVTVRLLTRRRRLVRDEPAGRRAWRRRSPRPPGTWASPRTRPSSRASSSFRAHPTSPP